MDVNGVEAERWASDRVREKEDLSWKKWAQRVKDVLATYDRLLQPELIVRTPRLCFRFPSIWKYI